jgi:hypothetical protein
MSDIVMISRPANLKFPFGSSCRSAACRAADWLCLAATPTFAIMALVTALGGSQHDMLCAVMQHASPFGGMVPMYLLMGAFHSAPWLKLMSRWQNGTRAR